MIPTLLLLGATGDLARRYLFPALGALFEARRLPAGFRVVGAARDPVGPDELARLVGGALPTEAVTYHPVDLAEPSSVATALEGVEGPVAAYLALPPAVYTTTIRSLGAARLGPGSRVVLEKPFGEDAASARALNALLAETGLDAYRVDHVLGMETTQNLLAMRRDNPAIARLWTGEAVEQVDLLWEETIALEGRAGFFDATGALVDVVQNHVLQLLALVAMEPPTDDAALHREKLEVLRAVRVTHHRRARYGAGTLADGRSVPRYAEEDGVDPSRGTETFVELELEVATTRWRGTRFVVRAGKALAERRKLVRLHLRGGGRLQLGIDGPEEVVLRLSGTAGQPLLLQGAVPGRGLPAYGHVLLDVLSGTDRFAVGPEVAVEGWQVVAPVREAWAADEGPLEEYPAGSSGPV